MRWGRFATFVSLGFTAATWASHEIGRRAVWAGINNPPPYQYEVPVTVVIPALNEEKYLPYLLQSLEHSTARPSEIIVCDSHSNDRTPEIALEFGAKVIDCPLGRELHPDWPEGPDLWCSGIAEARNIGGRLAKNDLILFTDADTAFTPTAIERMLEKLKPGVSLVHPRQVMYDEWGLYGLWQGVTGNLLQGWYGPSRTQLVRKADFEKVGGFRHMWREDRDFAFRVADLYGGRNSIVLALDAVVGTSSRRWRKEGPSRSWRQHQVRMVEPFSPAPATLSAT
jgi:glycosyltransferase involved in cell wall biosynthesis